MENIKFRQNLSDQYAYSCKFLKDVTNNCATVKSFEGGYGANVVSLVDI